MAVKRGDAPRLGRSQSGRVQRMRIARTRGGLRVVADATFIGKDLLVSIWGGNRPHIGAVAMAVPRPSLTAPRARSATSSVLTCIGHKEDEIVKACSEALSSALNTTVVVTAGLHWDTLSSDAIAGVRAACDAIVRALIVRATTPRR